MTVANLYLTLLSAVVPRRFGNRRVNARKRRLLIAPMIIIFFFGLAAGTAKADSFTFAPSVPFNGNSGSAFLFGDQHLGMRFTVMTRTNITDIGGHLNSVNGSLIFGAIVRLNDQNASPTGWPTAPVIASTTFNAGFQGDFIPGVLFNDVFTPLAVTLEPGDYALIFGAGEYFGLPANSFGNMPIDSVNVGGGSYIFWSETAGTWRPFEFYAFVGNVTPRFVIKSDQPLAAVPEPVSLILLSTGLAGVVGLSRQRRRQRKVSRILNGPPE